MIIHLCEFELLRMHNEIVWSSISFSDYIKGIKKYKFVNSYNYFIRNCC